ncbi:hypothetical protein PENTCL1PPCAC_22821, partial [Pristionchus entomophagus]
IQIYFSRTSDNCRMNESKAIREGLSSFVRGLIGKKLLVEMRGDKYVNGVLESCDCFLNLRYVNHSLVLELSQMLLNNILQSGRHIRFIHMDDYADVVACIRRGINTK